MKEKFLVGFSEKSITPDRPISLAGQFHTRISQYVETPVTVNVMALETASEQLILCSCDLGGISAVLSRRVRSAVAERNIGINPDKIIISATHTHTSLSYGTPEDARRPSAMYYPNANTVMPDGKRFVNTTPVAPEVIVGKEALDFLVERISLAVCEAWEDRKPSRYALGFGRACIGYCRRRYCKEGIPQLGRKPSAENYFCVVEGGSDSGIEMIFVFDNDGKPRGVVASVACPSQIVESQYFVSSDYWGKARINLKAHFGEDFHIVGLCSAAGDQSPRDTVRYGKVVEPSMADIEGTVLVGRYLSNAIIDAYEGAKSRICDEVELIHKTEIFDLPINKVTEDEYNLSRERLDAFVQEANKDVFGFEDMIRIHQEIGKIFLYNWQKNVETMTAEIHIARLGEMAIATNPFELFLDYGNQIKARSRANQTMLIQLACDNLGYLPTVKAEAAGGYGTTIGSCCCGHEGGEQLVEQTVKLINSIWE